MSNNTLNKYNTNKLRTSQNKTTCRGRENENQGIISRIDSDEEPTRPKNRIKPLLKQKHDREQQQQWNSNRSTNRNTTKNTQDFEEPTYTEHSI